MKYIIVGLLIYYNNPSSEPTFLYEEKFNTYYECHRAMKNKKEEELKKPFSFEKAIGLWKGGDGPIIFDKFGNPERHIVSKCIPR